MLLDTSGLLCYFDRADPRHEESGTLADAAPTLFTHSYILAEFVPLCHTRRLNRAQSLEFIESFLDDPDVDIVWVDQSLHREAIALLRARPDKTYSLCDAVSFILMRDRGITEALTTDRHFDQEGFVRLLAP
jgi:uncharacterized protein